MEESEHNLRIEKISEMILSDNISLDEQEQNQLKKLGNDEKDLKEKIQRFQEDEISHKNIAYNAGATNKGLYSIMDKIIQTGSRIAITISEKI